MTTMQFIIMKTKIIKMSCYSFLFCYNDFYFKMSFFYKSGKNAVMKEKQSHFFMWGGVVTIARPPRLYSHVTW